ncbi:MAG TPA: peptide ABC transporter substrate-binding protein [Phycisphaerae bacterium]
MFRAVIMSCLGLLIATLAWFGFAAPRPRAEFVYVDTSGINTLDPAQLSWVPDIRAALNLWEGLTTYNPQTLEPMEGVAYFPPEISADGLTYTFRLRPDARWSNGDAVTAADFVRGWRRCLEPGTAADYAALLYDHVVGAREYYDWRNGFIQSPSAAPESEIGNRKSQIQRHAGEMDERWSSVGIEALDPHTLRVRLKHPCPYFLSLTAFATLVPIHESIELLRERCDGLPWTPGFGAPGVQGLPLTAEGLVVYDPQWTKPDYRAHGYPGLITNGPYMSKEWTFKDHMLIVANPHYWNRAGVGVKSVDMLAYGDVNASIMAYEQGEVDCLFDMTTSYEHELVRLAETGQRSDFYTPPVLGTYYYIFNCQDTEVLGRRNPFIDARVRKAFSLAVDRNAIVEHVTRTGNPPSNHLIPPGMIPGYVSPAGLDFNPEEARRLLAEAGYPAGEGLPPLDLLYNTGFLHERICQVLAKMWERELGAHVDLTGKEARTFADDKANHNFLIARAGWYGDYLDPTTFLDICITGNGNNDCGYSNPAFDDLMRQAGSESDPQRRFGLLAEAERILIQDDFPILPLYTYTKLMAIKPYVTGLYPNPRLFFPFKYVHVAR